MIIVLKPGISKKQETTILREIRKRGYKPHVMRGVARIVIGAIGDELTHQSLETLGVVFPQIVESVMPVQKRYKLVSREAHPEDSTVAVREHAIGGKKVHVMAGPCSVESEKQLLKTAHAVKKAGATILRGGAFKPRTSPYEFQGLGERGLKLLAKARKETGLAVITELLSEQHAELVAEYTDIIQIGARNSQNFQLLIAAAATGKPILLKRGLSMKIEEWLLAGEYILANEISNLMFCVRGNHAGTSTAHRRDGPGIIKLRLEVSSSGQVSRPNREWCDPNGRAPTPRHDAAAIPNGPGSTSSVPRDETNTLPPKHVPRSA